MNLFIILELLSGGHIIVIALVLLLLFGGTKIPQLMKGLGEGIREFKKASKADDINETHQDKPMTEGK